ncbi:MAG: hypothetical protein WBW71_11560 [Bacteroidota bacterium]
MKLPKKYLSANGLLGIIRNQFAKIDLPHARVERGTPITLVDCLMSGLAVFSLKYPSLLKFDESLSEKITRHNLRTLFGVEQAPCDTYMRERCDEVEPNAVRQAFKRVFACVQRGKALEEFEYLLKGHYLLAGDGTGFFSSPSVHCENCCSKHYGQCHVIIRSKRPKTAKKNTYVLIKPIDSPWGDEWTLYFVDGKKQWLMIDLNALPELNALLKGRTKRDLLETEHVLIHEMLTEHYRLPQPDEQVHYYHNMFCAAIVHPDKKIVLPLAPEAIAKTDGCTKNDCERNAAKRLYSDARREHPHLKFIVVEDALASNVPHLRDLNALDMRYIVGVKPGDHEFLFEWLEGADCTEYCQSTTDGKTHRYRYRNQAPLNRSHPDFKVNFLEYWETDKKGKVQHFSWVTDIQITQENLYDIMRGGRSNWKIENNAFNTLKNQNYHFSHNFGHGYKNLCTIFGMLMLLAFFVDQVQELSCHLFKQARERYRSRTSLWERMRAFFMCYFIESWHDLFTAISSGGEYGAQLIIDS